MPDDPIIVFVLARLAEEEADARAAIAAFSNRRHQDQGAWAALVDENGPGVELLNWTPSTEPPETQVDVMGGKWSQVGYWDTEYVGYDGEHLDDYEDIVKHIARQDPRATLARVAALRALVGDHRPQRYLPTSHPAWFECSRCIAPKEEQEDWPCDVVKGVAAI